MRACCLVLALLALPLPARADAFYCELPWFARNLIFDRAGYCFGSPLGQALFDNSDCIGPDVVLSDRDRAAVAHIQNLEAALACTIDSAATRLEHQEALDRLRLLDVIPAPVEDESACVGYRGPVQPLRAAPGPDERVIGALRPGDDISFLFLNEGIWDYALIWSEGEPEADRRHGWAPVGLSYIDCDVHAG